LYLEGKMNTKMSRNISNLLLVLVLLVSGLALSGAAWAEQYQPGPPNPDQVPVSTNMDPDAIQTVRTRILARGATIHGANGTYFGPDGLLYIASFIGGDILVMDPNSGRLVRTINLLPELDGPDDLTFGPDGSLYWTSISTGKVGVMAPDGTQSLVAQLPPGANPITFSDDGRLFVALDFLGDGLYEIYLDGVTPPRLILDDLGWLNAFDFGPDGYLYGPIYTQGKVVKIDVDTGDSWVVADGFALPVAVKFDTYGRLHMLAQGTGDVVRMNPDGSDQQVIARLVPGLDNLAFDSRGRLFVTHAEEGSVYRILPNGKGLIISRGGMIAPGGVAALPGLLGNDRVFVADFWTLREFNGKTGRQLSVERHSLGAPHTVAADGEDLLVSSWMDNAVHTYDPASMTVLDTRFDFIAPMNAIRFQGDLVVSEMGTGMVVRSSGPGDRQVLAELGLPIGLAATDDDLFVADWAIGGVFQIIADGAPVFIPLAFDLAFPEGLAVAPDGESLLVVEGGAGRVSRIDLATHEVTPFVEGLQFGLPPISDMPPFFVFNGIAVGPSGVIYVSGDMKNVLYRIDIRP
jgi:sugar lactone lactonase YvrE